MIFLSLLNFRLWSVPFAMNLLTKIILLFSANIPFIWSASNAGFGLPTPAPCVVAQLMSSHPLYARFKTRFKKINIKNLREDDSSGCGLGVIGVWSPTLTIALPVTTLPGRWMRTKTSRKLQLSGSEMMICHVSFRGLKCG